MALGHLGEWVREARAVVEAVVLDENLIGGLDRWGSGDETAELLLTFTDAVVDSNITKLSLKTCGLGAAACAHALPRLLESARLTDLNLSDNGLTGATRGNYSQPWDKNIDINLEGWSKTCDKLKASNLVTLSLQKTGLGAAALRKLATSLPAAIARLSIAGEFRILHIAPGTHDNTSLTNCIVHIALRNGSKRSRG